MGFIMKDIVIGAITNYNWDKIKYWVNSLDRSGFSGEKVIIAYDVSYDTLEKLSERGYSIFAFKRNDDARRVEYNKENFNIVVDRFAHINYFLSRLQNKEQYRYVISTDVKDVVFQSNPSDWLEKNLGSKELNVACESIRYRDEPWGKQNLYLSFGPLVYEQMQDNLIYNAGTISGKFQSFIDFCSNIHLCCLGAPQHVPGGGGPDQAAMNVLLNMKSYKDITRFSMSDDGYAAQLGTTANPDFLKTNAYKVEGLLPKLIDGLVCTSQGVPFSIVHQYDRVPEWKKAIEEKYE
jgi:hypothetical protein